MPKYFFDLHGAEPDDTGEEFADVGQARNAAVRFLGAYLDDNPTYAYGGFWRVDVKNEDRKLLLHVVVTTVDAPEEQAAN